MLTKFGRAALCVQQVARYSTPAQHARTYAASLAEMPVYWCMHTKGREGD